MIYTLTLNPAIDRELQVPAIAFGEVLGRCARRPRAPRAAGASRYSLTVNRGASAQSPSRS